jgi:hypothetical protein
MRGQGGQWDVAAPRHEELAGRQYGAASAARRPATSAARTAGAVKDDNHEGADGTSAAGRASKAPASAAGAETTDESINASNGHGGDDGDCQLGRNREPARRQSTAEEPEAARGTRAAIWPPPCQRHGENARPGASATTTRSLAPSATRASRPKKSARDASKPEGKRNWPGANERGQN